MSDERRKLSNVLHIEPDFKRRQLARVLAFAGMYVALSTLVLGFFYMHLLHPEMVGSRPFYLDISDSGTMWRRFPGLRTTVLVWATCMTGLSSLFALAVGLHFSHKLAGPIYRFKTELARIAAGQPIRPLVLRTGDDFQDVAVALNGALARIERRESELQAELQGFGALETYRELQREVEAALRAFRSDAAAAKPAQGALLERLEQALAKCEVEDPSPARTGGAPDAP